MTRPEIDYEKLNNLTEIIDSEQWNNFIEYVRELTGDFYDAGRRDVLEEGPARVALLDGKSYWLDAAQDTDNVAARVVAHAVATAFGEWADAHQPNARRSPSLTDLSNVDMHVID